MYFRPDGTINYITMTLSTGIMGLIYMNSFWFSVSKVNDGGMNNFFKIAPSLSYFFNDRVVY